MELIKHLIEPAQPLILALFSLLFAWLTNEIRVKVRSTRVQAVLVRLTDLAETVTGELQQTVVDRIKQPGVQLDKELASGLKADAIAKVKSHLGPKGVKEMLNVFGYKSIEEVEALISSKIEASLQNTKQFGPIAAAVGKLEELPITESK